MMKEKTDLFWKLVKPEHLKARAFCRKLMGNRDDGDDLYQDALVSAMTSISELNEITLFRSWLYRIVVNTFKNRIRRRGLIHQSPLTPEIEQSIGCADPDTLYAARRRLERAFRVLSAEDRALVALFEMEGWSIAELAVMYRKKEGNIKVKLSRARKKMLTALMNSPSSNEKDKKAKEKKHATVQMLNRKDGICVAAKPGEN